MSAGQITRSSSSVWPIFAPHDEAKFSVLSITVSREPGDDGNRGAQFHCSEWLMEALRGLACRRPVEIITVVVTERLAELSSAKVRIRRAPPWDHIRSPLPLPVGERHESLDGNGDSFQFVGTVRSDLSQLEEGLELTRILDAAVFVDFSKTLAASTAANLVLGAREAVKTRYSSAVPNRWWGELAPNTIQAGLCALRATGWFDDRESGIDLFAPSEVLDRVEYQLTATQP